MNLASHGVHMMMFLSQFNTMFRSSQWNVNQGDNGSECCSKTAQEKIEILCNLLSFYHELLTSNQRDVHIHHFDRNCSFVGITDFLILQSSVDCAHGRYYAGAECQFWDLSQLVWLHYGNIHLVFSWTEWRTGDTFWLSWYIRDWWLNNHWQWRSPDKGFNK